MAQELTKMPDLRELIAGSIVPEIEDPELVKARIIDQVLSAKDAEELFAPSGSVATQELVGRRLELRDCKAMQSDIKEGSPVYLLLDLVDLDSGEAIVGNTSAPRVMAQAWRAKELGILPFKVQVVEAGKAKDGKNPPLGLVAVVGKG